MESRRIKPAFSDAVEINPKTNLEQGKNYPFVAMADMNSNTRSVYASRQSKYSGGGTRFLSGDTLMARIAPCLENGKIARFAPYDSGQIIQAHGSTEFIVLRGRPGISNTDFIYYLTQWNEVCDYAIDQMKGTSGRQRVPTDCFDHLIISLPPLSQQRAIARILGTLDDKIELNRRMKQTLEAMARAIFKDWFVDFGPTNAKAEGREPYLATELWNLFTSVLDDEAKPVGWTFETLEKLSHINSENWTTRCHPPTVEYVDLSNAKWGNIDTIASLDWDVAPSRARRVAKMGDTIVGTTRSGNGSYAYIPRDGLTVSTGFAVLSVRSPKYREAVYLAATSAENIERLASLAEGHGGAYPAVKSSEVSQTSIVFPGDKILTSFADFMRPIRERIESAKIESRLLIQTRDLLTPKLITGKISIRNTERVAENRE